MTIREYKIRFNSSFTLQFPVSPGCQAAEGHQLSGLGMGQCLLAAPEPPLPCFTIDQSVWTLRSRLLALRRAWAAP